MSRTAAIARSFAAAAPGYEDAAALQRLVATRLADRIAAGFPDPRLAALRVLEIGCGTGLLTRALRHRLPLARIVATDLAPAMLHACRDGMPADDRLQLLAMDGTRPAVAPGFDLICSSLALQWMDDPPAAIAGLLSLLAPGGQLQLATLAADSLQEWRAAHRAEGLRDGGLDLQTLQGLQRIGGLWQAESVVIPHADGLAFLRGLRGIGARPPAAGHRPLAPGQLRRVLRRFVTDHGATVSYQVAYGSLTRPTRRGVFVTGTDTGIGKTLVAACLARAWDGEYWKPLQTGLRDEAGDTDTVARLAGSAGVATHPPSVALQAPLSPEDAAAAEQVAIDESRLVLPPARDGDRPLVVEGAGGVLVPITGRLLTAGLIARLGLPAVLVARSTLGTINHTLLSLEALRRRGVRVAGVILNGPSSPGNRQAIERHGRVRVLAELPPLETIDDAAIARLALLMPTLAATEAAAAQ